MADNVTLPGTGVVVAAEDRSSVFFQRVVDTGGDSIAVGRYSATVTSAEAVAARTKRKRVILLALASNTDVIDVGPSGVASGSGFPLSPGASVTFETTAAIHADAASGTQVLAYAEEYD